MAIAYCEDDYRYIQLYDYTTECFGIVRVRGSDYKKVLEAIEEVQTDDSYDVPMFYQELAKISIDYELVEPEKVYF